MDNRKWYEKFYKDKEGNIVGVRVAALIYTAIVILIWIGLTIWESQSEATVIALFTQTADRQNNGISSMLVKTALPLFLIVLILIFYKISKIIGIFTDKLSDIVKALAELFHDEPVSKFIITFDTIMFLIGVVSVIKGLASV